MTGNASCWICKEVPIYEAKQNDCGLTGICNRGGNWSGNRNGPALNRPGGQPEFAYTAEKWASLRDDKLEFEEIADLVHEYNNTVIQNQIEYQDYRDQDKDDISDDYYEAAQDILNNLDYPDPDEAGFASRLSPI